MFETALITFREGLEAFLIVAITLAYLQKTSRSHLSPAVYAGIVAALGLSVGLGVFLGEIMDNPVTEGLMALMAGALVATMTVHVMRTAKKFKGEIAAKIDRHADKAPLAAMAGIFLFTVLMIAREGAETALMISSLIQDINPTHVAMGAAIGLGLTALIGFIWVKNAHLINLKIFLQTTGVFLVIFSIHLFLYGVHELSEGGYVPFVDNFALHTATEIVDGDTPLAQAILYSMIGLPCLWLAFSIIRDKMKGKSVAALRA